MKIHQVKTRLVNSYVIEYPDKLLVIDVALKCHRYVLGFIDQELGRDIHDVQLVVCTHDDPDHIGGVAALAELCEAQTAIPYASLSRAQKLSNDITGGVVRLVTLGREALRFRAFSMYLNPGRNRQARSKPKFTQKTSHKKKTRLKRPDQRLKNNNQLPGFSDWTVIHTPGHSWDSCCYYHKQTQSIVSGDTLLGSMKKGRVVTPSIYSNRKQTLYTLEKLRKLDISKVYPGHGSIIEGCNLIDAP